MSQHERLERLNFQAHQSAKARSDEFISKPATFDKLDGGARPTAQPAWREVFHASWRVCPKKPASVISCCIRGHGAEPA